MSILLVGKDGFPNMAKTKKEYTAPKSFTLKGDGIEKVTVEHMLERAKRDKKTKKILSGTDRPDTFSVLVPKNAAGLSIYMQTVDKALGKENAGMQSVLDALETAIVKQGGSARKEADTEKQTLPDVTSLVPDFASVRTVDENAAMANKVKAALVSGELSNSDIAALFAKIAKTK